MSKVVILSLGYGNLQQGFPSVTAQLTSDEDSNAIQFSASLPPAPEIDQTYKRWKLLYEALTQRLSWQTRIKIAQETVTQFSEVEFQEICQQLQEQINAWLNSDLFRPIDQPLNRQLIPSDEIRVVVETDDDVIQGLPWHLWNFFEDYPKAAIAFGVRDRRRVELQPPTRSNKVRILAILGSSIGIDTQSDYRILKSLPGAELVLLEEPERSELDEKLWDKRGWDILFFAGHSQTEEKSGRIYINSTESLTIPQLKNALKKAIARGLQLAIFNSCDGLGLAQQLAPLHIPQVIVMREPVPDQVAQAFLKGFLEAYAEGSSLYFATWEAREKLQRLESRFPCASWLPVLYHNPAVEPLTWQQLHRTDRRLIYTGVVASIAVTLIVVLLRQLGMLQTLEWQAFDQLIQLRPPEELAERLLIVEATEEDVNTYGFPIPDGVLAQAIAKLEQYQPRVIGLDIFRDRPVGDQHAALVQQFEQNENLVALCSLRLNDDPNQPGIAAPPVLKDRDDRLGFSNVLKDPNDVVRRHLVFAQPRHPKDPCATNYSFSAIVALHYLYEENISPEAIPPDSLDKIKIGKIILNRLRVNTGGYHQLDNGGFQVLLNYGDLEQFARRITLSELLDGEIAPNWVSDRVVLIGVTAEVSNPTDYFMTPYGRATLPHTEVPGVVLQAQMVNQILTAALDGRTLIQAWTWWGDAGWIWVWAFVGGVIAWRYRKLPYLGLVTGIAIIGLYGTSLVLLIMGWWIPLVPSVMALIATEGSAIVYTFLPPVNF